MLKRAGTVVLIGFALLFFCGAAMAEPILIRFSHVVSANDPKGVGALRFKELAEARLADLVRVVVYPGSELFTDELVLQGLLRGDVQLAAPSLSKFGSLTKRLLVFDLPFLFDDVEAVHAFQNGEVGQDLLTAMLDKGVLGLAYWDNGMRVVSGAKPLRTPADAEGMTIRIEGSDVLEAQYRAIGALPMKLPFGEVYDALRSGLVQGQENTWSNIASQRFYTLGQSFTETSHSYLGYMVVTSAAFWNDLPEAVRTELEKILVEVTQEVTQVAKERATSSRQAVIDGGAEVIELGTDERQRWVDAWKLVRDAFATEIGVHVVAAAEAAGAN
jgi:C4-dicarboxylate-binding protein DctP